MSGIQTLSNKSVYTPITPVDLSGQPQDAIRLPYKSARRWFFSSMSLITSVWGVYMMYEILRANELTALETIILILFAMSFSWLAISFWSGLIGFALQMLRIDPLSLKRQSLLNSEQQAITTRTAVVMPVYNEDTHRIIAGFEATLRSLEKTGEISHFDFFMLSDTTKLDIAQAERDAWQQLTERLGDLSKQIFYRRREKNIARKVGNLAEFCQRWGSNYEQMIVLDADSVMTGECLLTLVRQMQANPRVGLIQTVPIPVRQTTFFGRFVQFAAVLYSPMLATGLAFWQTDAANYWGHNAIIRLRAFIDHCGLPSLGGRAPFGGDILSHDFVEAAMLRRADWDVLLLADLEGSYEEVPCNIIDYATRDRRWVQGNIQHLGILDLPGLHPISRCHFFFGALAYITSLIWLLMLVLSTADAVVRALNANVYFTETYQLYPDWPIAKTELIVALIGLTTLLLMGPKLLGVIVTLTHRRKAFGGARAIIKGAFVETLFAVLIAPIMMSYHAFFVISVLLGYKVNWEAQDREGRLLNWNESFARTSKMTIVAVIWGWLTFTYATVFFWWLMPILIGLVLAAPLVRYSSSLDLGNVCRRNKIFLCPSETGDDPALSELDKCLAAEYPKLEVPAPIPPLPENNWVDMPHPALENFVKIIR
jgi:membrane glycosyltransferase